MRRPSRGGGLKKKESADTCTEIKARSSPKERKCAWGGDGIASTITTVLKDNIICEMSIEQKISNARKSCGFAYHKPSAKSMAMRPGGKGWKFVMTEDGKLAWIRIRRLTPRECFRLMDVSEEDIDKIQAAGISDSQQYKLAGNSIVVACMEGIFRNLFSNEEVESTTLF